MKKMLSLLIAAGLVSPHVFAQIHSLPQPTPGAESSSGASATGTAGATEASGASSASGSGASGASGVSGTSPAPADTTSGASNGMRSEAGAELQPPPSPIARLKPVTQDDVTYLCGGVGEEEVSYMKQEAKAYDLMLTFATRTGAYLADVDVDIQDAKGNTVLEIACDSPILLVDLPRSGTYRVRAEAAGYALNKSVKVSAGEKRGQKLAAAVLSWPQQAADAGGATSTATGSSGVGSGSGSAGDGTR